MKLSIRCLSVLGLLFSVVAQASETNSVAVSMKVKIQALPTCVAALVSARSGEAKNEVDFGSVYPHLIQNAPLTATASELSVMDMSNFGSVYDVRVATQTVRIDCDLKPAPGEIKISFQDLQGGLTPSDAYIPLFKLNNLDGNEDTLGFAVYAKDRSSKASNKASLFLSHGSVVGLLEDSFTNATSSYTAFLDLYPGLFWQTSNQHTYQPATLESRIAVNVSFN